jgi:uncharacterized radical SAM protein YgiQ
MFLPVTRKEMESLGWTELDVILVTGDTYIDSPYFGTAVIGKYLLSEGFRVGVIAQPMNGDDVSALGEPRLFWGVSSGCVDSMVSNYTPLKKKRNQDDLTPGGENNRRPDRALISYTSLIRSRFKKTVPVVLGGIDASLRRVTHYDCWDNKLRRSVLFDAKADILVYGMGEHAIAELARRLAAHEIWYDIDGICYASNDAPKGYVELPSFEDCAADKDTFAGMFALFYQNCDPVTAKGLVQKHGERFLVQNPPQGLLTPDELDSVYELDYEYDAHPACKAQGEIRALETIHFSVTTHRGCYGECNFCAISAHQGRTVVSRSEESILREIERYTKLPGFKGTIHDLGGPTANMYGYECGAKLSRGACRNKRCLYPVVCPSLKVSHARQISLLEKARKIPGVKRVFVASGIRYDLIFADRDGGKYLEQIVNHHVSGQMKVAPEHTKSAVLQLMGKPPRTLLMRFKKLFDQLNAASGKKQFLTYYFIAAHPGCTKDEMLSLSAFARQELHTRPEQAQIFTPTPSTWSTLMYYTGKNPFTGEVIFVERDPMRKDEQKKALKEPLAAHGIYRKPERKR